MHFLVARPGASMVLKIALAAAAVALGDTIFFRHEQFGSGFGLFTAALVLLVALARPALRHDRRALAALALAALFALALAIDPGVLAWVLFWIAATTAALLPTTARFGDGWQWFQRLLLHGLLVPFGPLIDSFRMLRARRSRGTGRFGLRRAAQVGVLPLLGSIAIIALFAAANPVIEGWLDQLSLPAIDDRLAARMMVWTVLLIMAWSLLRPRRFNRLLPTFDGSGDVYIPGVTPASVTASLIAFNVLFALQNAMDAAWLWGLFALPEGMTLAQYAHRGAYPLVATALLAALFVLVALRPGSATAATPLVRRLVVAWVAQNLFLVGNAALRTLDYVDAYSLTRLRIAALLWMALVGAGLVLICWRMLRGRSAGWLINANLGAAALVLTGCSFADLGAVAAQWNVRHAREVDGTGAGIDLCYLGELGPAALLPLVELEQRPLPDPLRGRVRSLREDIQRQMITDQNGNHWTWRTRSRLAEAQRRIAQAPLAPAPLQPLDCYDVYRD